ncbi:hypothetical protein FVA95_21420 [Pseudonocardia sp. EV170527-09]|uniref:hypothetical protein n=1 Tax=Pseudonocardia sp. EV170527-09 TaxID=2603411 RepID=UPI0011F3DD41|nr:hypothetical protein [Pseudonocardia sp. EV170527-09]KAA1020252.1 hypothetical protein FVA95_21420 [Pseudonocardia sp. EV170527-09]
MDADRSSPDPWATGRRRRGRPDRGVRPAARRPDAPDSPDRAAADRPTGPGDAAGRPTGQGGAADRGTVPPPVPGTELVVPTPEQPRTPPEADPRALVLPDGPATGGSVPSGPGAGRDDPTGPGPDDPWAPWRRLRPRSLRGATALGLAGAALLLLPFLDDPDRWWVPVGLGFGTLVLLALLRLDRLLQGWAPHVAGVVLVAALVNGTRENPWAWALALSVGVIVAGALLLPRWKVLALGVVLLVVSGVGYSFRSAEIRQDQARIDAQAGTQFRTDLGVARPQLALVSLDTGVASPNPARVCRLVQPAALDQVRAATGAPTCEDAVAVLHGRVPEGAGVTEPDRRPDPVVAVGATTTVDACRSAWGAAAPQLGRVVLTRTTPSTFQVSSFAPC